MKTSGSILMLLWLATIVVANDTPAQSAVESAARDARDRLLREILEQPINGQLTVGAFLERTDSKSKLVELLAQAQQIGGPRWLDDQTCQVRLEIRADPIRATLIRIAREDPRTPMTPGRLDELLADWGTRRFGATGTGQTRPSPAADAWSSQTPDALDLATAHARQRALELVIEQLATVTMPDQRPLRRWLSDDPARFQRLCGLLETRARVTVEPLGSPQTPGVRVTLTLGVEPVVEILRELTHAGDAEWSNRTRNRLRDWPGVFVAESGFEQSVAAAKGPLPRLDRGSPPAWAGGFIATQGVAAFAGARAPTARAAEAEARRALRQAVLNLKVDATHTLADLAAADPRVDLAISRALARARFIELTFRDDGSAATLVRLDGRVLWEELVGR